MIRFAGVSYTYPSGSRALHEIDLNIEDGEFVFLVGPSGSGKSTIMKLITAELRPTTGSILINGFNTTTLKPSGVPKLRRTLGIVFQDFRLLEKYTVYENVAFAMRVIGYPPKLIQERVKEALETVSLIGKERRLPTELSGGEQQRVAIARALVNHPQMIVADEPTGNLDPKRSVEIMTLLNHINREKGTTVLVVTHEKELVNNFDRRVVAIDEGRIVSDRTGGYYKQQPEKETQRE